MPPSLPSLKTLVSFAGNDGYFPSGNLIADATGNLFGTTVAGGPSGASDGTVFEIAKTDTGYSGTPTVLASFNNTDGSTPVAGLIADAGGNLFGTTEYGGANGKGTVFETIKTGTGYASTPQVLAYPGYATANPAGSLITDGAGDLFGTSFQGGNGYGTVFELSKTDTGYSSTPTVLHSFANGEGANPSAGLIADGAGNLFGTTQGGGPNGDGTVFEIAKIGTGYSSTPIALASFSGTDGRRPEGSLVADAAGNLFGTTANGGTSSAGTVFEIAKTGTGYSSTPQVLASFDYVDGAYPKGDLIIDGAGNLFGTTFYTTNGGGTVFEIAKSATGYSSTPTVLHSFANGEGANPSAGLIADGAGNLFGTTQTGGANNDGTVFELTDTGYQTACYREGTRIATERGEVPVETLAAGDSVVTASGGARPIRWMGHRTIECSRHPLPDRVWPVRIAAGALGQDLPRRDLLLSPDHCVLVGEHLIPAKCLLNGATVTQNPVPTVAYWHVELDEHDILLAEGAFAESYLDTGNRAGFANADEPMALHPDFSPGTAGPHTTADYCRPYVDAGPILAAARRDLAGRAEALGWRLRPIAADLHLRVDGRTVRPEIDGRWAKFVVPAGARDIRLVSNTVVPHDTSPERADTRHLGAMIYEVVLDDVSGRRTNVLLDDPRLGAGFHAIQDSPGRAYRWTDGDAHLDPALWAGLDGPVALYVKHTIGAGQVWTQPGSGAAMTRSVA